MKVVEVSPEVGETVKDVMVGGVVSEDPPLLEFTVKVTVSKAAPPLPSEAVTLTVYVPAAEYEHEYDVDVRPVIS